MKLFDVLLNLNFDYKLAIAIFVIVFMVILLVLAIVYIVLLNKKTNIKEKNRLESLNIFSDCVLNLRTQTVKIIKLNNLSEVRTIPFLDFLTQFDVKEQNELKLWFESLVVEKDPNENKKVYLATEVVHSSNKKTIKYVKTTLTVNQIDRNANVIYFVKEPQKSIPTQILFKKNKKKVHPVFYSYNDFKALFEAGDFKKGACYFIKLISRKDTFCSFNEKYIFYKVINNFFKYYEESNIYVLFNEENPLEILIVDVKSSSSKSENDRQLRNKINIIYEHLKKMCEICGFLRFFTLVAVSTKCSELPQEMEKSYDLINRFCSNLIEEKKNCEYLNAKSNDFIVLQDSYSDAVASVIRNNKIDIYFTPIIKATKKKTYIFGYSYLPKLTDEKISDYEVFKNQAARFDLRKECFSLVIKKTINNFIAQKPNSTTRLFSLIDLEDIPYANRLFPHISNLKDCNLVLTFKNNEFIDYEDDQEYIHVIKTAQSKGYDCALYININDYFLKDSTYKMFNYFLFNFDNYKELKANNREFIKIHTLLEQFVKFNKPIICVNVYNWAIIELLVKSGISYFSSPNIFSRSALLSPIDKKAERKFNNIFKE